MATWENPRHNDAAVEAVARSIAAFVDDTIRWVDLYNQYFQLASLLPSAADEPRLVRCHGCGASFGCVSNSQGVVLGHFKRRDREWSRLTGAAVINERRVALKCCACGKVTFWHRTKTR